jgi:hypothetical protein
VRTEGARDTKGSSPSEKCREEGILNTWKVYEFIKGNRTPWRRQEGQSENTEGN